MSNESKIIVKDACILFDLIDLDLLDLFFQLEYTVITTQAVIDEVTSPHQMKHIDIHLEQGNISIDSFGNDEFIFQLHNEYRGLSLTDCSVVDLAYRCNGILLSADKSVRKVSEKHQIEVHGIIWVITRLIDFGIISVNNGHKALTNYIKINPRAPKKSIQALLVNLELNM